MDYHFLCSVFLIALISNSNGQQFTGDCQILYQCQSETIKLINSNQNTGYHGLGLSWSSSTCGVIRQKLACIINLASTCSQRDDLTTQSTWSIIDSTRNYLIDKCSSNKDWSDSSCFKSKEITNCLANYPFKSNDLSPESCSKYRNFKSCIGNYVDSKCSYQDKEYVLIYLIGKGSNLTWICSNETNIELENDELLKNPFGNHIGKRGSPNYNFLPQNDADRFQSPQSGDNELNNRVNGLWFPTNRFPVDFNNLNSHPGQHIPMNSGPKDSPNNMPMMGDNFYQPVNPLQSPNGNPNSRPNPDRFFGRAPLNQLQNEMYFGGGVGPSPPLPVNSDPQISPMGMNKLSPNNQQPGLPGIGVSISRVDSCLQRANLVGRHCEEALNDRRDLARESRNPRDLKSNLCCGLLRYSDCFGKIVNQVCPNTDTNSVFRSIPESRRADMNSCQSYGPFNCNYLANGNSPKPNLTKSLSSLLTLIFILNIIN